MRRRDFIKAIAGSATWPLAAQAQQTSDSPVIGFLSPLSLAASVSNVEALRSGLQDLGFVIICLNFGLPMDSPTACPN